MGESMVNRCLRMKLDMTHPIDEKNEEWSIFQQKERKKEKDGEDETI